MIAAEGEFQAAERLFEASEIMSRSPMSLHLRYLQTLIEIGADKNSTTVFPVPMEYLQSFLGAPGDAGEGG